MAASIKTQRKTDAQGNGAADGAFVEFGEMCLMGHAMSREIMIEQDARCDSQVEGTAFAMHRQGDRSRTSSLLGRRKTFLFGPED